MFTVIFEWWDGPELFSEFVLVDVKRCTLASDVGNFSGLVRCHLLFHCDADLLSVVPLFW